MTFHHLTLNTGSCAAVRTSHLHRGRIEKCKKLWPSGGLLPTPWQEMRVDFGGTKGTASFVIWRSDIPMLMNVACWRESASQNAFQSITRHYENLSEKQPEIMSLFGTASHIAPPDTPWLATLILPSIFHAYSPDQLQTHLSTIAQAEQSIAAALIPIQQK